jgi:hypothetical protein
MTTLPSRTSIGRSLLRRGFLLSLLAFACFGLAPRSLATDTGSVLPNGNTADGLSVLTSPSLTGMDNSGFGAQALDFNTSGSNNTGIGFRALLGNTSGHDNTATGFEALIHNTTGVSNTAVGSSALFNNTTGSSNTATGINALFHNSTVNGVPGHDNTATGVAALFNNTTGANNTAMGSNALFTNTTGFSDTATGFEALFSNTIGADNTANGFEALYFNTTGSNNTATGFSALLHNTASGNTATGANALFSNTGGADNTAVGFDALQSNVSGDDSTAVGHGALNHNTADHNTATGFEALFTNTTGTANTAVGYIALQNSTGSNNIALGSNAGSGVTTGSNNIDIGNAGAAEAGTIRIGTVGTQTKVFVAGLVGAGTSTITGTPVVVSSNGRLGIMATSSARFKDEIKPMDKASETILALKPVTFRYKPEIDPERALQFGLVAEEVEKVNAALITRDHEGKPYTVRYEAVNAMLLNEFLKEHRKVEQQEATIAKQQKQIDALTAGLQKVSDQLELSKPAAQTVANNQ